MPDKNDQSKYMIKNMFGGMRVRAPEDQQHQEKLAAQATSLATKGERSRQQNMKIELVKQTKVQITPLSDAILLLVVRAPTGVLPPRSLLFRPLVSFSWG